MDVSTDAIDATSSSSRSLFQSPINRLHLRRIGTRSDKSLVGGIRDGGRWYLVLGKEVLKNHILVILQSDPNHLSDLSKRTTYSIAQKEDMTERMKDFLGSPGTWSGFALRIAQCGFAAASVAVMASANGFSNYTAFCYLIASMGLQLLWSLGLACLDIYALRTKRDLHNPVLVSLFVVGDWVTAILSFAAACSSAGVALLFEKDVHFCKTFPQLSCGRYALSVLLAFMTWTFTATSSVSMFWVLASL
ncbi:CASP-like protein [Rhynchospora pubera]|uniref:CASP-like protein n=1 Tax=Rhynchospora pubera TaxID=906938 RepID=A0AAV8DYN2_9POAL|nr:CASP-like protein [Rhynchospora pubera]